MNNLIIEITEWANHNFPTMTPKKCLLGMIEELGELSHAVLKMHQGIRGTNAQFRAEIRDAHADMMIFFMHYLGLENQLPQWTHALDLANIKIRDTYLPATQDNVIFYLAYSIQKIGFTTIFLEKENKDKDFGQNITALREDALYAFISNWYVFADISNFDAESNLRTIWGRVKERDWIKYPIDGLTQ